MIGHYLLTLTPEQEDRVLTSKMTPGKTIRPDMTRCLIGASENWTDEDMQVVSEGVSATFSLIRSKRRCLLAWRNALFCDPSASVPFRYDALCYRFGTERINANIRSRIWSNRASRTLRQVGALVA